MISLHEPNLTKEDWKNLNKCFKSGWISSQGFFIKLFEKSIKKITNSKYVVPVINGTAALHISLLLSGVRPDDEVIVPTITFISPVNAIIYNKANPVFMDVDSYFNLDQDKTIKFINKKTIFRNGFTYNKSTKKRVSALVIVHTFGNAANFSNLLNLCKKRNIKIVEDAAESLGTVYTSGKFQNKHTGTIAEVGCLSFNGNKIITSGGGGAILTKKKTIAKKALHLITQAKIDQINFIHDEIGYNYRISNIHAAIGSSQIKYLKKYIRRKKIIHKIYTKAFNKINGLKIIKPPEYSNNNYWINVIEINPKKFNLNKNQLIKKLEKKSIQARSVWHPNHLQKPFIKFESYDIKNANKKVKQSLCLPSSSQLTNKQLKKIISVICE